MLGRFNGIDILFIVLIGLYLLTLAFIVFYLGGNLLDKIQDEKLSQRKAKNIIEPPKPSTEKITQKEIKPETKTAVKKAKIKKNELVNQEKLQKAKNNANNKKKTNSTAKTTTAKKKTTPATSPVKKKNNATKNTNGYKSATKKKATNRKKSKKKNTKKKKK